VDIKNLTDITDVKDINDTEICCGLTLRHYQQPRVLLCFNLFESVSEQKYSRR
jgi:hypothetical protein